MAVGEAAPLEEAKELALLLVGVDLRAELRLQPSDLDRLLLGRLVASLTPSASLWCRQAVWRTRVRCGAGAVQCSAGCRETGMVGSGRRADLGALLVVF